MAGKGHPYHAGALGHLGTVCTVGMFSQQKKKKVSKFTKYFNTLKDQEAMLFHEWHSVSKVPKTILQFSCFLEGFTKIIKAVTLLFYYNEMMLIKISKRKRRIEQSSGESKHMFSSACAVI